MIFFSDSVQSSDYMWIALRDIPSQNKEIFQIQLCLIFCLFWSIDIRQNVKQVKIFENDDDPLLVPCPPSLTLIWPPPHFASPRPPPLPPSPLSWITCQHNALHTAIIDGITHEHHHGHIQTILQQVQSKVSWSRNLFEIDFFQENLIIFNKK